MIRAGVAAVLALAGPAAVAQDVTQQYAAVQTMFVWPGVTDSTDADAYLAAVTPLIDSLVGRWVAVDMLAMGAGAYDAALLPDHCAPLHHAIARTSPFSFDMVIVPGRDDAPRLTVRYDYAGMNQFHRSRDVAAFLERLGFGEGGPAPMASLFLPDNYQGRVALFHPSPDMLIMQPAFGRVEIYARCPGEDGK